MKTDSATAKGNIRFQPVERTENDPSNKKAEASKKDRAFVREKRVRDNAEEPEKMGIDQLANVKRYIQDNIQWKDMRFYRHEESGKMYVDIVDRETGEVIKTIPETEFIELAAQEKNKPGLSINISG